MKLISFRIQKFKYIIDSGWCNLSADNITALIGQNESGKSSILEALYCFSTRIIQDDYLRSDESFPEVTCSFSLSGGEIDKFIEFFSMQGMMISDSLVSKLRELGRLNFTRKWSDAATSNIYFQEESLIDSIKRLSSEEAITKSLFEIKKEFNKNDSSYTDETVVVDMAELKFVDEELMKNYFFGKIPKFEFFEDFGSLLPDKIDISQIEENDQHAEGLKGVQNFLTIVGITVDDLKSDNIRVLTNKLNQLNSKITKGFKQFWRQTIGKTKGISIEFEIKHYSSADKNKVPGSAYLVFWINDDQEKLYPKQRSKGVRWFLSFYLHITASAMRNDSDSGRLFLIDEPGNNLHAIAQRDVLEVLENIKSKITVIYATHAPHLLNLENIHRILAVQREEIGDYNTTKILSAHELGAASRDTLSPLYTLIGANFSDQQAIQKKNNVILEEISAFYYLSAFWSFFPKNKKAFFIPATGTSNVQLISHLFLGWGLEFIIVLDDDPSGRKVYNEIKRTLFHDDDIKTRTKMLKIRDCYGIEDLFSKPDLKKLILNNEKITFENSNSEYLKSSEISKGIIALEFYLKVKNGTIKFSDFDAHSTNSIKGIVASINSMLS